jgi:phage tail-like protein
MGMIFQKIFKKGGREMKRVTYFIIAAFIILGAQIFSPPSWGGAAVEQSPRAGTAIAVDLGPVGSFYVLSVKGIGDESEIVEYKAVQEKGVQVVQRVPGRYRLSEIVMKKFIEPPGKDLLYKWRRTVVDGKVARYNGGIVFMDATMKPVARYNFYNAWPSQWKGIALDGSSPQTGLYEEFVLTVERIERVQ